MNGYILEPTPCECFNQHPAYQEPSATDVRFHSEVQDTSLPAWLHVLELVEQAAEDGRDVFSPIADLSVEERRQIVTLPPTIGRLTAVRELNLSGSYLVRLPPEIGAMTRLEVFTPYRSYRLHWFPYEITRCPALRDSTVSTRALYGNHKGRPPFPRLQPHTDSTAGLDCTALDPGTWGATAIVTCSVCGTSLRETGLYQVWISLRAATDVLPLLVNACSRACLEALPTPHARYVSTAHTGGADVPQPAPF
jgi:hypothetical protein